MNAFKSFLHRKSIERSDDAAIVPSGDLEQDFIYDELDPEVDQIRLLELRRRSSRSGLIECDVQTFNITQAPPFQALSYEWGAADPMRQIRVNDALLNTRENLWAFLDMYNTCTRDRGYIWIDQICIDQTDLGERSHQVRLMSRVFSKATTVLVWLGENNRKELSGVARAFEVTSKNHRLPKKRSKQSLDSCKAEQCLICGKRDMIRVMNVLASLTYWRRLWIIQELRLAKQTKFHLGRLQIGGSHLQKFLELYVSGFYCQRRHDTRSGNNILYVHRLLQPRRRGVKNIWDLIYNTYQSDVGIGCSDPRDLVFGLLGIAKRLPRLRVDYTLATEEVFGDLLESLVCASSTTVSGSYVMGYRSMALPMAHLALRLGVPEHWCEALQIDRTRSRNCKGSTPENAALQGFEYESFQSALSGFLHTLEYLEELGLDKTSLSVDNLMTLMTHALHILRLNRWGIRFESEWLRDPMRGEVLAFFVKLTPRVKATCTERGVPFRLPHAPSSWASRNVSDEQLEELMWPKAEVITGGEAVPAQEDSTSCCYPSNNMIEAT